MSVYVHMYISALYVCICVSMFKYVKCRRNLYPALGIHVHTTVDSLLFVTTDAGCTVQV